MARRGSTKALSVKHEDYIAKIFDGVRSKSSGAAEHDAGDVRSDTLLIECKMTGSPGVIVTKPLPVFVRELEVVAKQAWEESKDPMLALRYYCPTSVLSGKDGWIDLTVRLAADDADREIAYAKVSQEASSH